MATLSVQEVVPAGITPTFNAVAAGGDEFLNTGNIFVEVVNSHASNTYTITFATGKKVAGNVDIEDVAVSLGTQARKMVGPFPVNVFNDSDGKVQVTYTGTAPATDLTMALVKMAA